MPELTKQAIAERVRHHIGDRQPGGVTLEVLENEIRKVDYWWWVPVRPSRWPAKMYEYYEELAEVESELQEREQLNILIATGEPKEEQAA